MDDLIEYLNNQLLDYDNSIVKKEQLKDELDIGIAQMQQSILDFENQKTQADADIDNYNACKVLVGRIIAIIEAS